MIYEIKIYKVICDCCGDSCVVEGTHMLGLTLPPGWAKSPAGAFGWKFRCPPCERKDSDEFFHVPKRHQP